MLQLVRLFGLISGNGLIFAIFALGFLALPYSPDMRKLFARLPIIGDLIRKSDEARLVQMRRIHNNSYRLITTILRYSIKVLIRWVALGVAVLLAYDALNVLGLDIAQNLKVVLLAGFLAAACPFLGIIQWVFWTRKLLHDLREYDRALRRLAREKKLKLEEEAG